MKQFTILFFLFNLMCELVGQSPILQVENKLAPTGSSSDIHADKDGNIWLLSYAYITKYDGVKSTVIPVDNIQYVGFLRLKVNSKGVKYVIDEQSQIFFIEADTLRAYEFNEELKKLNRKGSFNDFYFDEEERFHVSFYGAGYYVIDNGKISAPLKDKGIKLFGYGCVLLDNNLPFMIKGELHKTSESGSNSFILFDKEMNVIDEQEVSPFTSSFPPSVVLLKNGSFLYSTGGGHLFSFDRERIIDEIPYPSSLIGLFVDSKMGLWLSAFNEGIHYYEEGRIDSSKKSVVEGYSSTHVRAEDYEGGIWFRSQDGFHMIKNPRVKYYTSSQGYLHSDKMHMLEVVGNKLIITDGTTKLSIIDFTDNSIDSIVGKSLEKGVQGIQNVYYNHRNKLLWVSIRGSIGYIKNKEYYPLKTVYNGAEIRMNGKVNYFSNKIYQSKFDLDFAAFYLNRFYFVKDSAVTYASEQYPTRNIYDVLVVGDSIWLSTANGLFLQHENQITSFGETYPELSGNVVSTMYFNNEIWVSTIEHGLLTLSDNKLNKVIDDSLKNFINLFRISQNEMWAISPNFSAHIQLNKQNKTKISIYRGIKHSNRFRLNNNSSVLYGVIRGEGIQCQKLEDLKQDTICPPQLVFEKLHINNKRVGINNDVYQLEYNEGFIQINYSGISFKGKPIAYRHRMQGINDKWSETEERAIQFTTLPPGKYQFEIQAKRLGEFWGDSEVLNFEISPPFWQEWWFISGSALILLFIIIQVVAYRFRITQREQKLTIDRLIAEQKALRAQMDPHFVFNVVTSVQYLIMSKANEKAIKFLNMFTKSMRGILDQSSNNSISIMNEIAFLIEYMDMEQFRLENRFDYVINTKNIEEQMEGKIPTFIIQPFVENAIQHGLKNKEEKGHLKLDFSYEKGSLKLVIIDDGVGREAAKRFKLDQGRLNQKSYGMGIIKERLELHNSRNNNIQIEDLKDENGMASGTSVTLKIKMI